MIALLTMLLLSSGGIAQEEDSVISNGSSVSFEFTLTLADGTVVDSNVDREPLTYVHGEGKLFAALEAELTGMAIDKNVSVQDVAYPDLREKLEATEQILRPEADKESGSPRKFPPPQNP